MEEPQRARSHTVTTTASSFAENFSTSSSSFAYDREFLRTLPGLLIVAEIVLGLLVWTLIAGTEYFRVPAFGWVMFVAVFYWVLTVFFLIIYITMTYTRIPQVPWTTVVTLLIAFICVRSSVRVSHSAYSYFEVVAVCNLIMILVFYLVHLFRLYRLLTCISWPLSELLHYLIGTLLLLIASIVAASKSYSQSGLVAGAIFGFVATFLCLASIWMSYKISCVAQSADAAV
uniref:CKLF like MARVEL transmembrane domain containing 8 n=1 Tax=Ailuropoda melanoleuca TaxID=9646 RepID=A0A7N5KFQ4_AILME